MTYLMMVTRILCLAVFLPLLSFGFEVGAGSEFKMVSQNGASTNLSIYFVGVKETTLDVEFHFTTNSFIMPNMWQQFQMQRTTGPIKITKGYVKTSKDGDTEEMGREHFEINKGQGVELNDFLFSKKSEIDKYFVGDEQVEVPAGSVMSKHYRKVNNGQTVDFWISDQVKPIGLVKLVSKSKKKSSQNYSIELNSLVRNVAAGIDPAKAKPMSEATKAMFKKTGK